MNNGPPEDLSAVPMLDLFRAEAENQIAALTSGLLEIERGSTSEECLKALMRAAHSLKGAARMVNFTTVERIAHAMEDCFEAARLGTGILNPTEVDQLLRAVDTLSNLLKDPAAAREPHTPTPYSELVASLRGLAESPPPKPGGPEIGQAAESRQQRPLAVQGPKDSPPSRFASTPLGRSDAERVLRLTADNLNRLLGLAGESLVESRWLKPFSDSLQLLKRHHLELADQLQTLRQAVDHQASPEQTDPLFLRLSQQLAGTQQFLAGRLQDLDAFDRRSAHLSQRLYLEVLRTRMRPFSDGVRRFPRLVRDLARSLQKQVRIEISGESTQVDRDILERIETPLAHLLRNAVDHGCETSEARVRAGKSPEAVIRLDARHSAGVLLVTVSDDGAGVNVDELRRVLVRRKLAAITQADKLSEAELLEFLFVPGFSLKQTVSEISGRGFGLDVVQNMVRSVRGTIRLNNQRGRGFRVQLQLPLTLSVLRALLVQIAGEPYAIPLNQIGRTLRTTASSVHLIEGRRYLTVGNNQVGIVVAQELLELDVGAPVDREPPAPRFSAESDDTLPGGKKLCVVLLGERTGRYGLIVDRFLGERELVVQPLPRHLGRIKNVAAAALMEDGAPVLILDAEDLVRSIQPAFAALPAMAAPQPGSGAGRKPCRVLVVDDSATVRQLEQRLLTNCGYLTDVANDGVEAWNAVRTMEYDLVITDIEMPRLDGFELARLIKQDPDLRKTAVLIISYKDREEDRLRGLEAGADYYLNKGSFQDNRLLKAVVDLIGEPSQ